MTWIEYNIYSYGFIKRQTKEWEHTRTVMSIIYNTNVTKKHDQRTPDKILPLWTDNLGKVKKSIETKPITREEFNEVVKKLDNNG